MGSVSAVQPASHLPRPGCWSCVANGIHNTTASVPARSRGNNQLGGSATTQPTDNLTTTPQTRNN